MEEETNRVALQVQADTIPAAINPDLTLPEAEVNSARDFVLFSVYRLDKIISNRSREHPRRLRKNL